MVRLENAAILQRKPRITAENLREALTQHLARQNLSCPEQSALSEIASMTTVGTSIVKKDVDDFRWQVI